MQCLGKFMKLMSKTLDTSVLEEKIKIVFKDKQLLQTAFVHRSYLNEHAGFPLPSNEKLEFLGDSVLSLITSEHLYRNYPDHQEGDYTDIKAAVVNTASLYAAAKEFKTSYTFVTTFLFKDTLDTIIRKKLYLPAKNVLQEYYQDRYKKLPRYQVLNESGPEHNKQYEIGVYDDEKLLAKGQGKSKKLAEEEAARKALQKL